ncbi:MAG: hypothetical protein JXP34_23175 [Planctomycetes bacterium]|nr:hypothetical protein [Planctomycetota bacterium]
MAYSFIVDFGLKEEAVTYRGRVRDGKVILEEGVTLAEGTEVVVEPVGPAREIGSLGEGLLNLAGIVKGLPSDLARNHDQYIHGGPGK